MKNPITNEINRIIGIAIKAISFKEESIILIIIKIRMDKIKGSINKILIINLVIIYSLLVSQLANIHIPIINRITKVMDIVVEDIIFNDNEEIIIL